MDFRSQYTSLYTSVFLMVVFEMSIFWERYLNSFVKPLQSVSGSSYSGAV